jgi:hypothetical protein
MERVQYSYTEIVKNKRYAKHDWYNKSHSISCKLLTRAWWASEALMAVSDVMPRAPRTHWVLTGASWASEALMAVSDVTRRAHWASEALTAVSDVPLRARRALEALTRARDASGAAGSTSAFPPE